MSLLALKASIGGAPTLGEHHRDLGGKSGGGSEFTAIMSAMAAEDPQSILRAAAAKGAAGAQDRASPSANTPKPQQSGSIDAGLAGLVYSALAGETAQSNARPATTKGAASAQDQHRAVAKRRPTENRNNRAQSIGTCRARLRRARRARRRDSPANTLLPTPARRTSRSKALRGFELRRRQWVASRRRPAVARSGGTRLRREFRSGARRSRRCGACGGRRWAKDVSNGGERRPLSRPQRDTIPHLSRGRQRRAKRSQESDLALAGALRRASDGVEPVRRDADRCGRQRRAGVDRERDAARKAVDFGPQRIAKRLGSDPSAESAPAAVGPSASPALANPGVSPLATSIGPIAVDQLPESLATEASALTSQTAASSELGSRGRRREAPRLSRNSRSSSIPPISARCR